MKFAHLLVLAFIAGSCVNAFAQKPTAAEPARGLSQDIIEKYKPIPLTTNVISGELENKNSGKYHYYSFMAGRGEIVLYISLESTPQASTNALKIDLFDNNELPLGFELVMAIPSMPYRKATKIYIASKQPVVLRITEGVNFGIGKYRIEIGGVVEFSHDRAIAKSVNSDSLVTATQTREIDPLVTATQPSNRSRNNTDYLEKCLPKRGTLIIRMKDGSKRIVDLSEAETVTIVP